VSKRSAIISRPLAMTASFVASSWFAADRKAS
jgi:hypothetical protein